MPAFIHNRAEHILAKNPSMKKSMAFAIATQQSHALNKSPKGYGTPEGKAEAKQKYDSPKDYKRTANPGKLRSPKMSKESMMLVAFSDELGQIAKEGGLKDVLLKEIPGTKPWVIGNPALSAGTGKAMSSSAMKTVTRPKLRTGQVRGGAWDVSRQAQAMGL